MRTICNLIRKNSKLILHTIFTFILCFITSSFFDIFPDYLMFFNLLLALFIVFNFYKIIFKNVYTDSFLKIVCIFAILISSNRFYSYNKIIEIFPFLSNVNSNLLIVIITVILLLILLVFKLLTYIESYANYKINNKSNDISKTTPIDPTSTIIQHRAVFSFLKYLVPLIGFFIVMLIPICLLYLFNKYELDKTALDFDKVLTFLISYGSSFLLILFALVIVIITLIYVAKYIYVQIRLFKKASQEDSIKSYPVPTYAFSVIVVCILLFLAWRVTDFSLDDLTNELIIGDYLAFPIAVMITMILFFLLVQITHAIILLLSQMTGKNIKDFIGKHTKNFKIGSQIVKIIQTIVDIILDTIISTLDFVKFVPNFFASMSELVLSDDEINQSNKETVTNTTSDNIPKHESDETSTEQVLSKT